MSCGIPFFVKTDYPTTFDFLSVRSQISGAMKRSLHAASASALFLPYQVFLQLLVLLSYLQPCFSCLSFGRCPRHMYSLTVS